MGQKLAGVLALGVVLVGTNFSLASPVQAEVAPQPETSLYYQNLIGVRVNPLGLADYAQLSVRLRLFESADPALTQNYVGFGILPAVSPAWGRVGALFEVQPLTLLRLYAAYYFTGFYGSFNLVSSYSSVRDDFSDTAIANRTMDPATPNYSTFGGELALGARFQIKLGPIGIQDSFRAYYSSFGLEREDRALYDQNFDVLVPNDGWVVVNDLNVVWVTDFGLSVGGRYSFVTPFNHQRHLRPEERPGPMPDNHIHRLGLIGSFVLEENPNREFDAPTIILIAQWHLVHRFRTGADVHVAAPYTIVAFRFRGDLLALTRDQEPEADD